MPNTSGVLVTGASRFTGDIRDPHACKTVTRAVEVVFHLAALVPMPYCDAAPQRFAETTIKGMRDKPHRYNG